MRLPRKKATTTLIEPLCLGGVSCTVCTWGLGQFGPPGSSLEG